MEPHISTGTIIKRKLQLTSHFSLCVNEVRYTNLELADETGASSHEIFQHGLQVRRDTAGGFHTKDHKTKQLRTIREPIRNMLSSSATV